MEEHIQDNIPKGSKTVQAMQFALERKLQQKLRENPKNEFRKVATKVQAILKMNQILSPSEIHDLEQQLVVEANDENDAWDEIIEKNRTKLKRQE